MTPIHILLLFASFALPLHAAAQPSAAEPPEEFVVVGRLPGPPLWKVTHHDHVLWIFPQLSPVPKGMIWESDKVARVLAGADEVLAAPDLSASPAKRVALNPINVFRGLRLARRLSLNPNGGTLQDALPPDLYARYAALKAKYFPRDDDVDELRPIVASGRIVEHIYDEEDLDRGTQIQRTLRRLIRGQRNLKRTPVALEVEVEGGYREVANRVVTLVESLDPAAERACFEHTVRQMEDELDDRRARANAWALGRIDELRALPLPLLSSDDDPCLALIDTSSEGKNVAAATAELEQLWINEVERALRENHTTFAIRDINDLLRADGPLTALREKGYVIDEP